MKSCWWAVPPAPRWWSSCSNRSATRHPGRTCIRTCAWRWAPVSWPAGLPVTIFERVLVDVSPFSFGPSYLGLREGFAYPHCYHPIIKRNTPLPVTRDRGIQHRQRFSDPGSAGDLSGG